jgi:hypothetical protein
MTRTRRSGIPNCRAREAIASASISSDASSDSVAAVHEFGAELDRYGRVAVAMGENPAANPIPCLENDNIDSLGHQLTGCGESGCSGAQDENVGLSRSQRHGS